MNARSIFVARLREESRSYGHSKYQEAGIVVRISQQHSGGRLPSSLPETTLQTPQKRDTHQNPTSTKSIPYHSEWF